ncbi:histidine phosphatase family protein [Conservatibacter flavescens]|uniref:Histidine phosphatase family protein n=1 Tax=Conservatibacter flavescens TaxID=28161 RepID=A0A2M8S5P2_9PAST|nr:histidine phosphatase family protein [Conservatibacter flavescens]PJG86457.1 histidine phosphatase family protein [Conservatibacter flavescens]
MKQITFYLVRHGRTEWNEQGLMQGSGDSPLTEQGVQGAIRTGKALSAIDFSAVYTSCLQRTIDTAKYIVGNRAVPIFQHKGLNEHAFGSWEGQVVETLRQTEEFQQMLTTPAHYKGISNGGETYEALAVRAMNAMLDIIKVHDKGNILIVSHGHTLRILLALFNGATWRNHREPGRSEALLNTSISIVKFEEKDCVGNFTVEQCNNIEHL